MESKDIYRVSAEKNYKISEFTKEIDALHEAQNQSSKPEYKDIWFFVNKIVSSEEVFIASFINGEPSPGHDPEENNF